ncbi:MAG: DUF72 domain-containing protein [Gemmatimonadota bacterium]|nr:DUF72 domain-containing protein [Gemmatimonadota bacterium]
MSANQSRPPLLLQQPSSEAPLYRSLNLRVGCAGWSIPRSARDAIPNVGSHLQQYASQFSAVEINTSFYRPHKRATYERWAASTPDAFTFAVKIPKTITHELKLADSGNLLETFLQQAYGLGEKLGCLLVQLPPKFMFDDTAVRVFAHDLRTRYDGPVAIEPRHPSWFSDDANALEGEFRLSRVAADPAVVPEAATAGGFRSTIYYRLHGAPRTYYSSYESNYLKGVATALQQHVANGSNCWCIFDNTASGAATLNALELLRLTL